MAKFGGDVTVRRVTSGTYNTATGIAAEVISDVAIKGVLEDVRLREVNDLIQAGDKRLLVAALDLNGTAPDTSDRVVIGGIAHQVIAINTIEQDNEAITYELILRM